MGLSVGVDKPAELSGEDLRVAVSMEGLLVEGVGAFPVWVACQIQLSHFEQQHLSVESIVQYHPAPAMAYSFRRTSQEWHFSAAIRRCLSGGRLDI